MGVSSPDAGAAGGVPTLPAELVTQLEWLAGQRRLRIEDISPTPGGAITASTQVISGGANDLYGWAFAETTGTAIAAFRLHDGASAGGAVIARINLAAGESTRDFLGDKSLRIRTGQLYLEWISGSIEGTVYVR